MGKFFWAAHNFRQVKLTQNWPWQAISHTINCWNVLVLAPKINTGGSAGVKMSGFTMHFQILKKKEHKNAKNPKNVQKKAEKTKIFFFAIFRKRK